MKLGRKPHDPGRFAAMPARRALVKPPETLLRPLPFPESDRLVKLWEDMTPGNYRTLEVSAPNYQDWKQMSKSFSGMAAFRGLSVAMLGSGTPQQIEGTSVAAGPAGTGTLQLDAANITLNGGSLTTSGFDLVALSAGNALTATASSGLSTGGALSASASLITTGADDSLTLSATGAVSLLAPSKHTALSAAALGGSLTVTGSSIDVGTEIELPSGRVDLTATGGTLSLTSGGSIDVAGVVRQYDGVSVASPGGAVSLASASWVK